MGDQKVGRDRDISTEVLAAPLKRGSSRGGASQLQPLPGAGGQVRVPSAHTHLCKVPSLNPPPNPL